MDPYQNTMSQPSADIAPNTASGPHAQAAPLQMRPDNADSPNTNSVSPMVGQLQNFGRNNDSMLMHVTPGEVAGLQGLAQAAGGSLTTNPTTGLPEAGFLENILPTVLGFALSPFTGGLSAAALVGGGEFLASGGNLQKGLMAGLGAFGGAGLGGMMGLGGAGAAGSATAAANTAQTAASQTALNAVPMGANAIAAGAAPYTGMAGALSGGATTAAAAAPAAASAAAPNLLAPLGPAAQTAGTRFAGALSMPGVNPAVTTGAGALGLSQPVSDAFAPAPMNVADPNASNWDYKGPYKPQDRKVSFPGAAPTNGEYQYFANSNPYPGFQSASSGFAGGGSSVVATPAPNRFAPIQQQHIPFMMQQMGATPPQGRMPPQGVPPQGMPRPPMPDPRNFVQSMMKQPVKPQPAAPMTPPPMPQGQGEQNYGFTPGQQTANQSGGGFMNGALPGNLSDLLKQYGGNLTGGLGQIGALGSDPTAPTPTLQPQPHPFTPVGGGETNYGFSSQGPAPPPIPSQYQSQSNFAPNGPGMGGIGALGNYFAAGGDVAQGGLHLENGAFIVDARTVSELGNGSSSAGQDILARYGGQPIHGPGDGVSDSVPANIAGVRPAAVARDEVKFSPEAVARIGGGDLNKGTKKLYDMMARAQKARQTASRGQDTGLQGVLPK